MLAAQPRFSGHRRPLQPKNESSGNMNPKPCVEISSSNKENVPPSYFTQVKKEAVDPSLNATREKLERLRCEEVRNEKALRERSRLLDLEMKEILIRGEVQKQLELELDRLYRLNEINLACMRTSRLRSLRDKEEEKKMKMNKAYIYIQGRESLSSHKLPEF
ncbi:uncharacterized protein LOC131023060 [Salvia miltiorrhiza]|uniref:uncharacterized protein LOC131023060 n=1 Tax=Salvia miltiorrhiza TaxID=226208 RepID=UPI0025AC465E|nr:uncharacterized protein LOC131023060 [Salvia miltiorrhiza]